MGGRARAPRGIAVHARAARLAQPVVRWRGTAGAPRMRGADCARRRASREQGRVHARPAPHPLRLVRAPPPASPTQLRVRRGAGACETRAGGRACSDGGRAALHPPGAPARLRRLLTPKWMRCAAALAPPGVCASPRSRAQRRHGQGGRGGRRGFEPAAGRGEARDLPALHLAALLRAVGLTVAAPPPPPASLRPRARCMCPPPSTAVCPASGPRLTRTSRRVWQARLVARADVPSFRVRAMVGPPPPNPLLPLGRG